MAGPKKLQLTEFTSSWDTVAYYKTL